MGHTGHAADLTWALSAVVVGAKAKDKTETALNTAVGNGTLTLHETQQIIKTDRFKYVVLK
jgi:hypothetical protein